MKRGVIFVIFILFRLCVCSQILITAGSDFPRSWTPDSLVRDVLLAEGEEVFNVKFNGQDFDDISCNALGYFTTGSIQTNLGMYSGVIISTGHVWLSAGPNTSTSTSSAATVCANYLDPSLSTISGGNKYDASTLELDFVPKSDTIRFRYVFASEEYPEFAGGGYNDIFGFFISGPNPSGGEYENKNIALIPDTDIVISINTVNHRTNSDYYVNNDGGSSIQYDGFTTVLTAKAVVVPCQTYHLKMSICDIGDDQYNSAVFIEAESFSSNTIYTNYVNPTDGNDPLHIYEGCYGVDIEFKRPTANENNVIPIEIIGTASDSDYQPINPSIVFNERDTMYTITISPTMDGVEEGPETVVLIYQVNHCEMDTIVVTIHDTEEMRAHISYIPPVSEDTAVVLTAMVENGYISSEMDYTYLWNTGEVSKTIIVSTVPTTEYWFEVEDKCKIAYSDTVLIGVLREFAFTIGDTSICKGDSVNISVLDADYQLWNTDDTMATIVVKPDSSECYIVTAYKWWNNALWEDKDTVCIKVRENPTARIVARPDMVTTANPVTNLVDVSIGGTTRLWDLNGEYRYESSLQYTMPYADSVEVKLISYNDIMCSDTTTKVIYMISEELWIPNAFTPMADNNNLFEIKARNLHTYNIQIYTRTGELIYESTDINRSWDGRYKGIMCMQGAYAYVIRYSSVQNPNNIQTRKGTVLLNI
ncbi:MAG: choice-of-anchor L domain-containing protein [Bacteroidales bacterium]|nr:choice-of-anchor L domain-containing protein [Bacteroidales bacterium]